DNELFHGRLLKTKERNNAARLAAEVQFPVRVGSAGEISTPEGPGYWGCEKARAFSPGNSGKHAPFPPGQLIVVWKTRGYHAAETGPVRSLFGPGLRRADSCQPRRRGPGRTAGPSSGPADRLHRLSQPAPGALVEGGPERRGLAEAGPAPPRLRGE